MEEYDDVDVPEGVGETWYIEQQKIQQKEFGKLLANLV